MKIALKKILTELIAKERQQLIIWTPVFFGTGIIFFFSYNNLPDFNFNVDNWQLISDSWLVITLFLSALILASIYRKSYRFIIIFSIAVFLFGYLWALFYDQKIASNNKITGVIYAKAVGRIKDLKINQNAFKQKSIATLVIGEINLYQIPPHPNKHKAATSYQQKKQIKKKLKAKKITKNMTKNWLNIDDMQEIDRQFLEQKKNYQIVKWVRDKKGQMIYKNPPDNIIVTTSKNFQSLRIGDLIAFNAVIQPIEHKQIIDDFDHQLDAKAKKIGARGFITSNIAVIKHADISSYEQIITRLRQLIADKIAMVINVDNLGIANALLIGKKDNISQSILTNIRKAGLAHLLAISGLHLSLMAGFFFGLSRYLLSFNQYLTLRFDIKKIAALIAIIGSYFYLEISGCQVTATRAFIMILLFFVAIILEEKPNPLIALALAAIAILLFNPYQIFTVSFQLSFTSVACLITFYQNYSKTQLLANHNSLIAKSSNYLFQIIICSIVVQITTAEFLIYHFNNVALYGLLANIFAIPIVGFLTIPLGFLAIILMPFGLEKYTLKLMSLTIDQIIKISNYVANLNHSSFSFLTIPKASLITSTIGLLLIFLPRERRLLPTIGLFFFLSSILLIFIQPKPSLLIDGNAQFFAIYNQQDGLIFSKEIKNPRKRDLWLRKAGQSEFRSFTNYQEEWLSSHKIDCSKQRCTFKKSNFVTKDTLILLSRNHISEICKNDFQILINLTKKYQIPSCVSKDKIIIDNNDLLKKGTHFIYF